MTRRSLQDPSLLLVEEGHQRWLGCDGDSLRALGVDALVLLAQAARLEYLQEVGDPATGEPIGDTEKNLKAAVAGETYEYTQMYPGFAKTARDEGHAEIAEWFETLAKAEKSHAGRFAKGLQQVVAEG